MLSYANRKVLVIDTDRNDRTFIRALLASSGYDVYCYPTSGINNYVDEIVSIYETWKPEILLLDSSIPKFDTGKLVALLKSNIDIRHTPILIMSNLSEQESYPNEIKQGADGFIKKPLAYAELKASLENLLQIKNL